MPPKRELVSEAMQWFSPYAVVPEDIVLNAGESLDVSEEFLTLVKEKSGDADPMFVTFALQEGFSRQQTNVKEHKRHRFWPKDIVYEVADIVNKEGAVAYDGHASLNEMEKLQIPGAKWVRAAKGVLKASGTAVTVIKGYVLKSREDLREALRIGAIDSASLNGFARETRKTHAETKESYKHVDKFEMLSIDFVRKGTEGMPTYKIALSTEDKYSKNEEVSESMDVQALLKALGATNLPKLPSNVTEALSRETVEPEIVIQRLVESYLDLSKSTEILKTLESKLQVTPDKLVGRIDELVATADGAAKVSREAALAEIKAHAITLNSNEAFAKIVLESAEKLTTEELVAKKATYAKEQHDHIVALTAAVGATLGPIYGGGGNQPVIPAMAGESMKVAMAGGGA